jgi:hypothetical protein
MVQGSIASAAGLHSYADAPHGCAARNEGGVR